MNWPINWKKRYPGNEEVYSKVVVKQWTKRKKGVIKKLSIILLFSVYRWSQRGLCKLRVKGECEKSSKGE